MDFQITDVKEKYHLRDKEVEAEIPKLIVEMIKRDGSTRKGTFFLGTAAIEESIAIIVEEHITKTKANVPVFPYRILDRLFKRYVKSVEEPMTIAMLGTISLMSSKPAVDIVFFIDEFSKLRKSGVNSEDALQKIVELVREENLETIDIVLGDLDELVEMHEGRGLLEQALIWLRRTFTQAFELRKQDRKSVV